MRYLIMIMACWVTTSFASEEVQLTDLSELKWKNRVILLHLKEQQSSEITLQTYQQAIKERDVIWFIIQGQQVLSNYDGQLAAQFTEGVVTDYPLIRYPVLLIGKDGGIKARAQQLDIEQLFSTIDSMPMRQQEMRQQND